MESQKMNVRQILVAASAVAILAGSSYGALASQHHYSKPAASSYSKIDVNAGYNFWTGKPYVDVDGLVKTNASDDSAAAGDVSGKGSASGGSHNEPITLTSLFGGENGGNGHNNGVSAEGSASGFSCSGSGCDAHVHINVDLSGNDHH
jgi:hypothetical protein